MWKIASVLITYWLLVKLILPAYMRDRKPYSLKIPIRIFNALMVMVNLAAFIQLFYHIDYGRRFLDFSYPDRSDNRPETLNELYLAWIGYMSRYLDMFDTIFFCLRKKHNQITFLHVYHHMVVPFLGKYFFSFLFFPVSNLLNTFIRLVLVQIESIDTNYCIVRHLQHGNPCDHVFVLYVGIIRS